MRRTLTTYAFLNSVFGAFALLALAALSSALLDHWHYVNPDDESLNSWTTNAPRIARVGLLIPGLLFVISILSLKRSLISDRLLVHGIAITALSVALMAAFVVVSGMMPAIVTITEMPMP